MSLPFEGHSLYGTATERGTFPCTSIAYQSRYMPPADVDSNHGVTILPLHACRMLHHNSPFSTNWVPGTGIADIHEAVTAES
jgi:hypothetical protein